MDYYVSPTDQQELTRAHATAINDVDAAVASAFAKVPVENDLKRSTTTYGPETGAVNAYVVTLAYAPTSYADGMEVVFRPSATNSAAATINVNGLGAKSIVNTDGTALSAGAMPGTGFAVVRYSTAAGKFVLMNSALINTGTGSYATLNGNETLSNKTLTAPIINGGTLNSVTAVTQSQGDSSTKLATTAYVDTGLALKANLASPALTGTPSATTASANDNSTRIATTAYVDTGLALKANLASPTFSGTVSDASGPMRDIPQNSQDAAYVLALTDRGKHVIKPASTARTYTVPLNATVAFPLGSCITIVNLGGTSNNITISRAGGVALYRAGTNADVTLTPGDMVTLLKVGTDTWQC
jgi:hypothetical protein